MMIDQTAFNQIATALSGYFDSLFYVEIETGRYTEFVPSRILEKAQIAREGDDFFVSYLQNARKNIHPNDLDFVSRFLDRSAILESLAQNGSYSIRCRLVIDGKTVHVRHIGILCEDKKHFLFCMENIDDEVREKEEQEKILQSAERMARRDELTGIKNKNAFVECSQAIDKRIQSIDKELDFGIIMCDVNDLKRINDTRGHYYGDEILQRASHMICDIFQNSQVYRIGGDEFVVVLAGEDLQIREELLENLRRESYANGRSRSGPVVASGIAVFEPATDARFSDVLKRADRQMYENKRLLKFGNTGGKPRNATDVEIPIPDERKRILDAMFGALFTMAGEGYIYLNDLRYDYSRWSISLVDDFGIPSEYMYHAGQIWQKHVHPDDVAEYKEVVDAVICGNEDMNYLRYRARRADGTYVVLQPRSFVLNDSQGNPEYFGGIIIPQ